MLIADAVNAPALLSPSPSTMPSPGAPPATPSALRHQPSLSFHVYRRCRAGAALLDALDEALERGLFLPRLAYALLQQLDHALARTVAAARASPAELLVRFGAGRVVAFRVLDGMHAVAVAGARFYQLVRPGRVLGCGLPRRPKPSSSKQDRLLVPLVEAEGTVTIIAYSPFAMETGR